MKILYWSELFWPNIGGVEVLSNSFIPAMQERGHEYCIITSISREAESAHSYHEGSPVYRFGFHHALNQKNLKKIKEIVDDIKEIKKSFEPDLVHINYSGASPFFHNLSGMEHNPPTLTTIHSLPFQLPSNDFSLMRKLLISSDWVAAVSGAILDDVLSIVPSVKPRSSVIYNSMQKPSCETVNLNFDVPQLLCLGRLANEKGFDVALKAMAIVIQTFPRARMVIAGDGPERMPLEQLSLSLGLTGNVSFLGWVPPEKTSEVINASCMLILPARWREPFCLVALEAAHLSRPVVASRTGALPEVILDKITGLLVEKEDPAALAESVMYLINNPAIAKTLGSCARQRAVQVFDWNVFISSYDALYHNVATMRRN